MKNQNVEIRHSGIYVLSVFLFIAFLSFTSGFAFGPYLRIYVVFSITFVLISLIYALYLTKIPNIFSKFDAPLLFFITYISLQSLFINNEHTLIYLTVYLFFFIFVYYSFKLALKFLGLNCLLRYNLYAIIFISTFVIFEITAFNFYNFDIHQYISRFGPTPNAVLLDVYKRAYAFSTEPTNLAAYLLPMGGLAIYYLYTNKVRFRNLITLLIFSSIILTFSAAAIASIIIGIIISYLFWLIQSIIKLKIKISFFVTQIIYAVLLILIINYFDEVTFYLIDKITFQNEIMGEINVYQPSRSYFWLNALDEIFNNSLFPFGLGSNAANSIPIVNTYILIAYETGFIGFLFFLSFFILALFNLFKAKIDIQKKIFLIFLVSSCTVQLNGFSTFYYPYAILLIPTIHGIINKES